MKPEIKAKWVTALRSGEYKQDYSSLKTNNGYCCLGVLCDLHEKETKKGAWEPFGNAKQYISRDTDKQTSAAYLPNFVMDWAGLESAEGRFRLGAAGTLAYFNDQGYSFEQIAAIIEEQF